VNKVLVLSGNYRPNFRDMVAFRNSGKDAMKEWEKERNTRIDDRTGSGWDARRPMGALYNRGVRKKEFGIRNRSQFHHVREAA
jgi:hypothetical protein